MDYIRSLEDFEEFLAANRDEILAQTIRIEDLPEDDEWFQEDEWDEIYEREVIQNGKA
ncbi:MAG: hypothetical protein Q4D76_14960 [Oscillospiraceae bacterium]|nr:hypothetical protein [Oscillospiraceae bacterium]